MQSGIRGNAGKHHKIFFRQRIYCVSLSTSEVGRTMVLQTTQDHKISATPKKINPNQKTNEHLRSHPSPTKKQTEIIPVRCNYDKTIAKFPLPLEIDLDSGPCI